MDVPSLACPTCARKLEYQITIEMLEPPIGKIDTGYCGHCSRIFERVRQTGAYEVTMWAPVCRVCRQPVAFAAVDSARGGEGVRYQCRDHPSEAWTWTRGTDEWTRI
jgi:hypothetical protein